MKKLLSTSFLAIAICFLCQTAAFGQYHGTKLGVGITYGSEIEAVGLRAGATFRVSEDLGIAPNIEFYFLDDEAPFGIDSFIAFNLDGHFMLETDPEYHIYALGGLNITSIGDEDPDPEFDDDFDESETELGLNLGLGGELHLDDFSLFSELKYVIAGDFDRVVLGIGIRFPI